MEELNHQCSTRQTPDLEDDWQRRSANMKFMAFESLERFTGNSAEIFKYAVYV